MTGREAVLRTQGRYYVPLLPGVFAALPIAIFFSLTKFAYVREVMEN